MLSATGLALHLALGYLYVVSGLVVPEPVLLGLGLAWGGLLVFALARWRRPGLVMLVPVVAAAVWAAVVLGLGSLLEWSP